MSDKQYSFRKRKSSIDIENIDINNDDDDDNNNNINKMNHKNEQKLKIMKRKKKKKLLTTTTTTTRVSVNNLLSNNNNDDDHQQQQQEEEILSSSEHEHEHEYEYEYEYEHEKNHHHNNYLKAKPFGKIGESPSYNHMIDIYYRGFQLQTDLFHTRDIVAVKVDNSEEVGEDDGFFCGTGNNNNNNNNNNGYRKKKKKNKKKKKSSSLYHFNGINDDNDNNDDDNDNTMSTAYAEILYIWKDGSTNDLCMEVRWFHNLYEMEEAMKKNDNNNNNKNNHNQQQQSHENNNNNNNNNNSDSDDNDDRIEIDEMDSEEYELFETDLINEIPAESVQCNITLLSLTEYFEYKKKNYYNKNNNNKMFKKKMKKKKKKQIEGDHDVRNESDSSSESDTDDDEDEDENDDDEEDEDEEEDDVFFCRGRYSQVHSNWEPLPKHDNPNMRFKRALMYSNRKTMCPLEDKDELSSLSSSSNNNNNNNTKSKKNKNGKKDNNKDNNKNNNNNITTIYNNALQQLQISVEPKSLPCREKEAREIMEYTRRSIKQGGLGGTLYVCGMPGSGKTAVTVNVMKALRKEKDRGELPNYKFITINGMTLGNPKLFYSELWRKIDPNGSHRLPKSPKDAVQLLTNYFNNPTPNRTMVVLLVDELDYLITRRQDVLYNLFSWPSKEGSKIAVVGIANTMDLPERLLPRVYSRLHIRRVNFGSYGYDQLTKIIRARIEEYEAFDPIAIEFCARKVAFHSGDVRRAFRIASMAIEIHQYRLDEYEESVRLLKKKKKREATAATTATTTTDQYTNNDLNDKLPPHPGKYVTVQDINRAQRKLMSSPIVQAVKRASVFQSLFYLSLIQRIHLTGRALIPLIEIKSRMQEILGSYKSTIQSLRDLEMPSYENLKNMVQRLMDSGLVEISSQRNEWYPNVKLAGDIQPQEIANCLFDSEILGFPDVATKCLPKEFHSHL